jgi:predicted Zn-dependent protease
MFKSRVFSVLSGLAIGLVAVNAGGCTPSHNDKQVVSQAASFHQSIAPAAMQDTALDGYLQQVGGRIVAAAKEADKEKIGPKSHFAGDTAWMFQDVHFYLVNSKTLNAFTTGGHAVYIYNELFQLCKSEDQLAAVMSHEFAHIYCRHVQKGMNNEKWVTYGAMAVGGAGYVAGGEENGASYFKASQAAAASAGQFVEMGFTRGDESQADHFGQIFYAMAGWDPARFGDFFRIMKDKVGDVTTDLTSDHPSLTGRYEKADKQAPELEKKRPNPPLGSVASPADFTRYQQMAVALSSRMPNDSQVLNTKKLLDALPRSCWVPVPQADQIAAHDEIVKSAKVAETQPTK